MLIERLGSGAVYAAVELSGWVLTVSALGGSMAVDIESLQDAGARSVDVGVGEDGIAAGPGEYVAAHVLLPEAAYTEPAEEEQNPERIDNTAEVVVRLFPLDGLNIEPEGE